MSNVGDERWRNRGRQNLPNVNLSQNPNRSLNQQRQIHREQLFGTQSQRAQSSELPAVSAMSGNVWVNNREASQHAPAQEQAHLSSFDTQEARDTLKKAFNSEEKKAVSYKAPGSGQNTKAGGPWGSKPNTMGNGKDFFLELRKQLSTLQQQNPDRAGG